MTYPSCVASGTARVTASSIRAFTSFITASPLRLSATTSRLVRLRFERDELIDRFGAEDALMPRRNVRLDRRELVTLEAAAPDRNAKKHAPGRDPPLVDAHEQRIAHHVSGEEDARHAEERERHDERREQDRPHKPPGVGQCRRQQRGDRDRRQRGRDHAEGAEREGHTRRAPRRKIKLDPVGRMRRSADRPGRQCRSWQVGTPALRGGVTLSLLTIPCAPSG